MSGPSDPFGRDRGEEGTDMFGNRLTGGDPLAGSAGWLPPAPEREAAPSDQPPPRAAEPAWLPPSEAAPGHAGTLAPGAQWPPPASAVTYATWLERLGAAVVDFFVRLGIVLAFVLLGAIGGDSGITAGAIIGALVALAYAPVMMSRSGGQTLGHRAVGTRIVRGSDGAAVTGGAAAVREVLVKGVLFDGIGGLLLLPTLLNYLWPLWDERNEALHDKMCNTRVVEV